MLGRIEAPLEAGQPEEQHGFRTQKRIEEHLLTTNLVLDKPLHLMCQRGLSVWICRRRQTGKLGKPSANMEYRIICCGFLLRIYHGQKGRIEHNNADGDLFHIRGGVRQGCVLSPRLLPPVFEAALGRWRRRVGTAGVDFQDGMRTLLDLRFADDHLLFAKTFQETKFLLDELVTCFASRHRLFFMLASLEVCLW